MPDLYTKALMRSVDESLAVFDKLSAHIGPESSAAYGLNDSAVQVLFGPDIENMVFLGDELITHRKYSGRYVSDGRHPLANDLLNYMNTSNSLRDFGYRDSPHGGPHNFEGDILETRLHPQQPLDIIRNFHAFNASVAQTAESMGLRFVPGRGHWHMSLRQENNDLFEGETSFNPLALDVALGILEIYEHAPALLIRPHRVEEEPSTTHSFKIAIGDEAIDTIRLNFDYLTIEPRLAMHPPEQPVAVLMRGILHGLKQRSLTYGTATLHPMRPDVRKLLDREGTTVYPDLRVLFHNSIQIFPDHTLKYLGDNEEGFKDFADSLLRESYLDQDNILHFPEWAAPRVGTHVITDIYDDVFFTEGSMSVARGHGGFLEVLTDTRGNSFSAHLMGQPLADLLLLRAVESYEQFFATPRYRRNYTDNEISEFTAKVAREFPENWRQSVRAEAIRNFDEPSTANPPRPAANSPRIAQLG